MLCRNPRRLAALSLLLALAATASQAQSSYTLSELKPPAKGGIIDPYSTVYGKVWVIDASDRVVSSVTDVERYVLKYIGFVPEYGNFVYRWPASASSSVAGSRLYSKPAELQGVTPDGLRIAIGSSTGSVVRDTVQGKTLATNPAGLFGNYLMNNQGLVVGLTLATPAEYQATGASYLAARVTLGGTAAPLGASGYGSTYAWAVNAAGLVGGSVQESDEPRTHAAIWRNGRAQVLPEPAGHVSTVVALNDKEQALILRAPVSGCALVPDTNDKSCNLGVPLVVLRTGTTETALLGAGDARGLGRVFLNNAGVVVGRINSLTVPVGDGPLVPLTNHGVYGAEPRTFIWQNGTLSDLTTWVGNKGAKLPAGAVLTDVLALNDKGSLVAVMKANGTQRYVRLTAKP